MREQVLKRTLQEIEERVQLAVCPIYGLDPCEKPFQVGSAILFTVATCSFLVTAAHVLDENKHTTLYVAGLNKLVPLAGPSHRVQAPPTGRKDDSIDMGFVLLSKALQAELGRFTFLKPQDIDVNDSPAHQTLYAFVGYPETKNRLSRQKTFQLSSVLVAVTPTPAESYEGYGLNPTAHFVGGFDRSKLVDAHKQVITGPMPHGMSGGGVWRLGSYDQLTLGMHIEKLIGIGIEYR